jgi:hypothetical protein
MKEPSEMPERRALCLILLISTLLLTPNVAKGETQPSLVKINVTTTPEPYLNQLTSGDRCRFNVTITNLGVSVQKGEIVNASDPTLKYSGNFTVETLFELRKQGNLWYAGQSVGYTTSLNNTQIDNYYSVEIPQVNDTIKMPFTYNLTKGYEILGVRPDENLVFVFRVNVFVQTYSEKDGQNQLLVGERVQTQRNNYYVIDYVKQEYLRGKYLDIKVELSQLDLITSSQAKIGRDYYDNVLGNINATLANGNYVYALDLINNYYEFEQPKLTTLLVGNLNATGGMADKYVVLTANYSDLSGRYTLLQSDFDGLMGVNQQQSEQIADLTAQIKAANDNQVIMLGVGMSLLFIVGYIFGRKPSLK